MNIYTNLTAAKAAALSEGKWVLAELCTPTCSECMMQWRILKSAACQAFLAPQAELCSIDITLAENQALWPQLTKGLGNVAMPVHIYIEPSDTKNQYFARSWGLQGLTVFKAQTNNALKKRPAPPTKLTATDSDLPPGVPPVIE